MHILGLHLEGIYDDDIVKVIKMIMIVIIIIMMILDGLDEKGYHNYFLQNCSRIVPQGMLFILIENLKTIKLISTNPLIFIFRYFMLFKRSNSQIGNYEMFTRCFPN